MEGDERALQIWNGIDRYVDRDPGQRWKSAPEYRAEAEWNDPRGTGCALTRNCALAFRERRVCPRSPAVGGHERKEHMVHESENRRDGLCVHHRRHSLAPWRCENDYPTICSRHATDQNLGFGPI